MIFIWPLYYFSVTSYSYGQGDCKEAIGVVKLYVHPEAIKCSRRIIIFKEVLCKTVNVPKSFHPHCLVSSVIRLGDF